MTKIKETFSMGEMPIGLQESIKFFIAEKSEITGKIINIQIVVTTIID